jgi:hypothetical protein
VQHVCRSDCATADSPRQMLAVLKCLGLRIAEDAEDREPSILPLGTQEGLGERMMRLRHVQNRGGGRQRNGIAGQRAVDEGRPDDGERPGRCMKLILGVLRQGD